MTRNRMSPVLGFFLLATTIGSAQPVVELPSLSIEGTRLESIVRFDGDRGIYIYDYTLFAAETNQAPVSSFSIDTSGRIDRPQLDPDLRNNIERLENTEIGPLQPPTTIPVGVIVPDPAIHILAGPTTDGSTVFVYFDGQLQPGETRSGFKLESKFPPAWREAVIQPSSAQWIPVLQATSAPDVEYSPASDSKYWIHTRVLAPYDLDEAAVFLGGGQSPREVNPFLRFAAPTESRTSLPAGTEDYDVTVVYGPTTDPTTFSAMLDGVDITSRFRPMPGVIETVTIPLEDGSTKLQLSIEGKTSSGRTARDTDTLTFLVK
jgi:hypothetical protein